MFNKNVVAMVLSCGLVMVNGVGYSQAPGEWYITSKILPIPSDAIGSDAYGLNDKGDVTGAIYLPDGNSKPVIWTYNDEINYLQLAEDIDPLSINTGKSISQDGTMVSGYLGGIYKLVIWKNTELQPGVFLGEFSKFFGDKLL